MKRAVFVTGNANKAKYFNEMVGVNIEHIKYDVDEIQSTSLREIVEHKVRQAYEQAQRPVIVEDTRLSFNALGSLPGPFIKWFIDEVGLEGICRMLDGYDDRSAIAGAAIAYYDGTVLEIFERELTGTLAEVPLGDSRFGWNSTFIPDGSNKTLGQMDEDEFKNWYKKIKPFNELAKYLNESYS